MIHIDYEDEMVEDEETEPLFLGRYHSLPEDGLFSEFEQVQKVGNGLSQISGQSTMFWEGVKRSRFSSDKCQNIDVAYHLKRVLQSNASLLNTQVEAQNMNCQVDREQRKRNSLVTSLDKITDALAKIADKL
ncbi:unnamed protein product [Fraxinus pennsylvanica]|uniref:Uncharacterized protein n=1 Tax=Fraxinus pennsylvanica TaxID=56036 RepID=A0AAD1ZCM2_9LAMI|nr:unnamed protein product [Fraxinus pennsylvanica]